MINESDKFEGLVFLPKNFMLQMMNCFMICFISLQTEIFNSPGYVKFVTQTDGSMDFLVKIADLKAKSISYVFNNLKIRKIISIQRRKEVINSTVELLKDKIKRWRLFTRTTLETQKQNANVNKNTVKPMST